MPVPAPTTPRKPRGPVTLFDYLGKHKPEVPDLAESRSGGLNTRNDELYRFTDIPESVPTWKAFNYTELRRRYRSVLNTRVNAEPASISPQHGCPEKELSCEDNVAAFVSHAVTVQLNRAFKDLYESGTQPFYMSDNKPRPAASWADRVGFHYPSGQLRLVGEIKVSWKWTWSMGTAEVRSFDHTEFRQVLSQVHHYMNVHGTRYAYILTDREFVAIKRDGKRFGDISISKPVPWSGGGPRVMSITLASWFIHMLAAEETDWHSECLTRNQVLPLRERRQALVPVATAHETVGAEVTELVQGEGRGEEKNGLRRSKRLAALQEAAVGKK